VLEKLRVTLLYDIVEDTEQVKGDDAPVYKQVATALKRRGHEVKTLAADANLRALVAQVEKDDSNIIFNLCESLGGVDRHAINVAALLELLGKPFTGAGAFGLTLAQDKGVAKKIYGFHGIRSPKFSVMEAGTLEVSDELEFPLFVKPSNTDSSVGIDAGALVTNVKELMERISYIHTEFKAPVLIEEFIEGRELFVGVLGNDKMEALPIIEWDFSKVKKGPKFATAEAKWDKRSEGYKAPEFFPEDIPESVYAAIQHTAVEACKALKILDYGRVDMRLRPGSPENPDGWEHYIIEVNPNPYLDQHSEVALAAKRHGLNFPDLIERILESALKRSR
jgi:D-alanine-D-alanine ligase